MSRVLLIDDEVRFCQATSETLRERGHDVTTANGLAAAREALRETRPEVVLLDLMLPDGNGLELLEQIEEGGPSRVVVITGHPAIKAHIRNLAGPGVSYLTKPVDAGDILRFVEETNRSGEPTEHNESGRSGLLGNAASMRKVFEAIEQCGPTEATVLIEGESGTGKELVAKALHRRSGRGGRFVAINCGALAGELLASELFGHEKGSFTGATRRHTGVFERADGGTLFLDEIAEMPLDAQTYLLRSLESREITRVGSEHETRVDTRLVAATNKNPADAVRQGALREDLFYRLSEFTISLPPLRERNGDIELLVEHFVKGLNDRYGTKKTPSPEFLERCREYEWPGNVRELKHVVHRAYLLSEDPNGRIEAREIFENPFAMGGDSRGLEPGRPIRDVERELIFKTLDHFGGDKKTTAETLGISLKTLYNRLNEYKRPREAAAQEEQWRD